jgi:hypothetical protein
VCLPCRPRLEPASGVKSDPASAQATEEEEEEEAMDVSVASGGEAPASASAPRERDVDEKKGTPTTPYIGKAHDRP